MQIKCELCKGHSDKTGKDFYYLYIEDIEKRIFLEPLELKAIALIHKEVTNLEVKK